MSKIMWIIGAGASYHLGLPLLSSFKSFFQQLLTFKENQRDPLLGSKLESAIKILDKYPNCNGIESILATTSPASNDEKRLLKQVIGRGFERRNLGRVLKYFGPPGKLATYSRLLCAMSHNDVVVSFNYDNAIEVPLCLVAKNVDLLNTTELDAAQMLYLESGQAMRHWIPNELVEKLRRKRLTYNPSHAFSTPSLSIGDGEHEVGLIKIHGSINWCAQDSQIHIGRFGNDQSVPLIVYPEGAKPELQESRHLSLINAANEALAKCDAVIIIGYSFPLSDSQGHPFVSKLATSLKSKRVLAIDPFPSDNICNLIKDSDIHKMTFEEAMLSQEVSDTIARLRI